VRPVFIGKPSVAVPGYCFTQAEVLRFMQSQAAEGSVSSRKLLAVYRDSGIDRRYSVLPAFGQNSGNRAGISGLSTPDRMRHYEAEALRLGLRVLETWNKENAGFCSQGDITHLVWVSCTGLLAPGMETLIRQNPGFSPHLQTTAINFMGCHGFFHALRFAAAQVRAEPRSRVLVVCTELCTLHFQDNDSDDRILANSLFGDGAAAVLIGGEPEAGRPGILALEQIQHYEREEASQMAWMLGTHGFGMKLSRKLPDAVSRLVPGMVDRLFPEKQPRKGLHWIIHPGGKRILDQLSPLCGENVLRCSREALRNVGNVSSASILFALREFLSVHMQQGEPGILLGVGPGLALEAVSFVTR
jgi:predicted naringenin-chalcone synthase